MRGVKANASRSTPSPLSHLGAAALPLVLLGLACGFPRQLDYHPVRSELMGGARLQYAVWTPPDFDENERLPLITFLHGGGDDPAVFDRHGLTDDFNRAVLAGEIPRAVIFFPQGDNGFWTNWYDGTRLYRDWILNELIPEVQARYHTRSCPEDCHLMGVSMGGYGSLTMAIQAPDHFASVSALSAPIFDTDQTVQMAGRKMMRLMVPVHRIWGPVDRERIATHDPFQVWRAPEDLKPALTIRWGSDDREGILETNVRLHEHLEERGIPHTAQEYTGNHSWVSWGPVIREAMIEHLGPDAP